MICRKTSCIYYVLPIIIGLMFNTATVSAQSAHRLVHEGNEHIEADSLSDALTSYLQALDTRDSLRPEILYNIGGVYSRMGTPNDVMRADSLYRALPFDASPELRSQAAYNRGTALANSQMYDQAMNAFIESLVLNPDDDEAKHNLEMTRQLLMQQEQQQQQQGDGDNDENQDQQDQEQQQSENQEQQDGEQQEQDEQSQPDQEQSEEEQQEEQEQPQPSEEEMTQEEMDRLMAERFLDQLQENEEELLQQVIQAQIPQSNQQTDKPW